MTAQLISAAGDVARALDLLETSYEEHSTLLGYAKMDPRLDPLRGHPRFEALVKRIGLAGQTSVAGHPR